MSRLAPLALLAALAPSACLSGFSEIRVQGGGGGADASSDRPLPDVAPARDAAEDRVQLADGGDAPTDATALPEAAADAPSLPDVVVPVDLGAGDAAEADVVDGGAWDAGEDRTEPVDVQAADAWDAGASADTPAAPDVVDAGAPDAPDAVDAEPPQDCGTGFTNCTGTCVVTFSNPAHCGACGNTCGDPTICVRGTCATPTRFVGVVTFGAMEYARNANAVVAWDGLCAARYGATARVCTTNELYAGEVTRFCAVIGDPDGGTRQATVALGPAFIVARGDGTFGFPTYRCVGTVPESRGVWDGPTQAACCAP